MRFLTLNQAHPLVIDECQSSPRLFPALKEWVRVHPRPGQLLLSGSVRFSSRKAIRESLTGRLVAWELLPMDLSELHQAKLPDCLSRILDAKSLRMELPCATYATAAAIDHYAQLGGLPGIAFVRNEAVRLQKLETQINTLLERDLKLIIQTTLPYSSLRQLLVALAKRVGLPLDWAALGRETRISPTTLKKLVTAFEAMFLIRLIPTLGAVSKPVLFFEDVGEANFLAPLAQSPLVRLQSVLFSNLRPQIAYRPEHKIELFQYRTRSGSCVPLCFRKGRNVIGIIPLIEEYADPGALGSARSFLTTHRTGKVLLVHTGKRDEMVTDRIRMVGLAQLV